MQEIGIYKSTWIYMPYLYVNKKKISKTAAFVNLEI